MNKGVFKKIGIVLIVLFALIGLIFTAVFFAMQFGLLNVRGANAARNAAFVSIPKTDSTNGCVSASPNSICDWNTTVEWSVVHDALIKDTSVIEDVAAKTGVSTRMIAATVIPEQLRYFTANRESFKKYFEPLKILSSLSKFSLGVSGIKQETAADIERYANDPTSPFYPGPGMADLIMYPADVNHDAELYKRLTDAHNHYYSYLYTALFIKEIEAQWLASGFDVHESPEVILTLFNIGFVASHPNPSPQVAGSTITLGGKQYSYGELGTLFYNSNELTNYLIK